MDAAPPSPAGDCRTVYVYWPNGAGNHSSFLIQRQDFPVPEAVVVSTGADAHAGFVGTLTGLPTDWVEVGFGNLDHYLAGLTGKDFPWWKIAAATRGAVQVRPFPLGGSPARWLSPNMMFFPVDLPEDRYTVLMNYISASFARGRDGTPILEDGTHGSGIYLSTLTYSYRRFCNSWLLQGLKVAGFPTDTWMPHQDSVKEWFREDYREPAACARPARDAASAR